MHTLAIVSNQYHASLKCLALLNHGIWLGPQNLNKRSKDFDEMPHRIIVLLLRNQQSFLPLPLLTTEWFLLLYALQYRDSQCLPVGHTNPVTCLGNNYHLGTPWSRLTCVLNMKCLPVPIPRPKINKNGWRGVVMVKNSHNESDVSCGYAVWTNRHWAALIALLILLCCKSFCTYNI